MICSKCSKILCWTCCNFLYNIIWFRGQCRLLDKSQFCRSITFISQLIRSMFLFTCQIFIPIFNARCDASAVFAVTQCLSVCLSVTFVDHVKTNKDIYFFTIGQSDTILVFPSQRGCGYSDGNPPNGGVEYKGYDKVTIFSQISRCISEMVIDRLAHAARQFVSIAFSFHPYNIQRDCLRAGPEASPGETKMWAAVRKNGDF